MTKEGHYNRLCYKKLGKIGRNWTKSLCCYVRSVTTPSRQSNIMMQGNNWPFVYVVMLLTKVTTPFMARVLDGVLYLMTLTFESVDEILWCHHSNESSLPVLSYGAICLSKFYKIKFGNLVEICLWPHLEVKGLQSNLYIVVTLYIRDTRILPKIFSCLIYFLQSWP